jgi:DNA-binding transcriptional LysR family regulator
VRIEQLEYFAAVVQHGSLRRAGDRLHVSQPAISEGISKLERELGTTLLERHRSGARVNTAGRELLPHVVEVLGALERLQAASGDHLALRRVLRIGTVNAGTSAVLLPAVHAFQDGHPGSTVEIRNLQQDEIHVGLAEGTIDVGLVSLLEGDDVPPDLEATTLLTGSPVAVVPASHPLAGATEVTAQQLRAERFVAMRSGYLMHRFAHRIFGADLPREWHAADGAEMGKLMVAEGIGIAVLPDYSVQGDPLERAGLIVSRPIAGDAVAVTMVAVNRRQDRTPGAVRDLLAQLREQAGRAPGRRSHIERSA